MGFRNITELKEICKDLCFLKSIYSFYDGNGKGLFKKISKYNML